MKYPRSKYLPLALIIEDMERDPAFVEVAQEILATEDRLSTYSTASAASALINHWLALGELKAFGAQDEQFNPLTVTLLPDSTGRYDTALRTLEETIYICKDALIALLRDRGIVLEGWTEAAPRTNPGVAKRHADNREECLGAALACLKAWPEKGTSAKDIATLVETEAWRFWPTQKEPPLKRRTLVDLITSYLKKVESK